MASEKTGKQITNKTRIWEVDFCRGVAIVCVLIVHFFAIFEDFGPLQVTWSPFFYFVKQYWGAYFVFLSGLSAYLGSKSVKRGFIVFGCAVFLTIATTWLYKSGREGPEVLIQWGVLHLLGFCMIVYPLFKNLKPAVLLALGIVILGIGYYLYFEVRVQNTYLFPLGLYNPWFYAWDYFPILPYLGWYLCGTGVGKLVYPSKKTIFPQVNTNNPIIKFFSWFGQKSLYVYMASMVIYYVIASNI